MTEPVLSQRRAASALRMRALAVALIALTASLGLVACGESKQDKAKNTVCSARADIKKQVQTLQSLTLSSSTANQVSSSLDAIKNDVQKISNAQSDLSPQRKTQVQNANKAFSQQVQSIVSQLGSGLSPSNAEQKLKTAANQLAASYQSALAPISC